MKRIIRIAPFIIIVVALITISASSGIADESEGVLNTFCPHMSIGMYYKMLKSMLELNDTQAAALQVSADGTKDGNLVYSNVLQDTIFIFGGISSEFDTAQTAYVQCSLKDSSTLKNIPMLIWAANVEISYYGEIKETGSTFMEWINTERSDGDTFSSDFFTATFNETPLESCSLLLTRK